MRDLVILRTLHFWRWNAISQLVSHSANLLRSFSASQSDWSLICLYTMESSAKCLVFEAILSGRSVIKRTKSKGPSTDPWGTPLITDTLSDELASTTTRCVRSVGKDAIQLWIFLLCHNVVHVASAEGFDEVRDRTLWRIEDYQFIRKIEYLPWTQREICKNSSVLVAIILHCTAVGLNVRETERDDISSCTKLNRPPGDYVTHPL